MAAAWRGGADRDWSAPAGGLTWSCAEAAEHAVDATMAPAFFLASRRTDDYPPYGVASVGRDPVVLAEAVEAAARVLAGVAAAGGEAIIWRRPAVEVRPAADFPARGALELVLHGHDVCAGLGVAFRPDDAACDRLRRHTAGWPHWASPGWSALSLEGDPWADLLRGSGRA